MHLHEVLADISVLEWHGDSSVDVREVTHDSRRVGPATLFCCVPGAHVDGHDFAADAVERGASALLVERPILEGLPDRTVTQARVASVRVAMAPAAARAYGEPSHTLDVLGVTGTNGKTTTVHLLESIARAAGSRTGVIGTVGARIDDEPVAVGHTTPEATDLQALLARMRDHGVRVVAMEVSSEGLAQHRADALWFGASCFTNLSQDHLNFHGTMDAYFEAKSSLFTPERTKVAVVNTDDEFGRRLLAQCADRGVPAWSFSVDAHADVRADVRAGAGADVVAGNIVLRPDGASFELSDTRAGRSWPATITLVGRHNVANAVAAATTALAAGFDADAVVAGLARPLVVPGRMEVVASRRPVTVLVDYAHTPDALRRVLEAARPLAGHGVAGDGHVLVVFGCGGDRDAGKRAPMGEIAGRLADVVVVTTDNSRSEDPAVIASTIAGGVVAAGGVPEIELDRRAAIRAALTRARPGDVVVIAGKGHEPGQTAGGVTLPFDDRAVAREELEALGCA